MQTDEEKKILGTYVEPLNSSVAKSINWKVIIASNARGNWDCPYEHREIDRNYLPKSIVGDYIIEFGQIDEFASEVFKSDMYINTKTFYKKYRIMGVNGDELIVSLVYDSAIGVLKPEVIAMNKEEISYE